MTTDVARPFAEFISGLRYEDIPADVVEIVSVDILDFFGNALGGSSDPAVEKAGDVIRSFRSAPQCTVLGSGMKTSPVGAAFLNGTMGFALDFDDTHERANTHLGVACIPAALAAAEICGAAAGCRFITALAGAMEIGARLGAACRRKIPSHVMGGWDYAALHGTFTAAAAAAKLMKLDAGQIVNAFGIAYQMCAGNTLSAIEEADSKKLGPGIAAGNGVLAALMASSGITGASSVFTASKFSLFNMYHDGGDPSVCTEGLGHDYMIRELGMKIYPCCRLGHRHIDAVLELLKANGISAHEVKAVTAAVCPQVNIQLCQPKERKTHPASRAAAQFSLHWALACALLRGRVTVEEFLDDALKDKELQAMAERVETVEDVSLANEMAPAKVVIQTAGGTFQRMTGEPLGSPANPVGRAVLEEKFKNNVKLCRKKLTEHQVDQGIRMLRDITDLEDMTQLITLFS